MAEVQHLPTESGSKGFQERPNDSNISLSRVLPIVRTVLSSLAIKGYRVIVFALQRLVEEIPIGVPFERLITGR